LVVIYRTDRWKNLQFFLFWKKMKREEIFNHLSKRPPFWFIWFHINININLIFYFFLISFLNR